MEYSEANEDHFATNIDHEFLFCSAPNSTPNVDADYKVFFMKKLLKKKYFPIGHKALPHGTPWITSNIVKCIQKIQKRLRLGSKEPWITSSTMDCIRKIHKW